MRYYNFLKPIIFKLPPEFAHNMAIFSMKNNLLPKGKNISYDRLKSDLLGMKFDNPIGLAAGFDKNAEAIRSILKQGFGFAEFGTVTPKPQSGNPKPRLFRLVEDEAVINCFGFNSKGVSFFKSNLLKYRSNYKDGIVGINFGKNKLSNDPVEDYISLMRELYMLGDYITINISSPNTPGLRKLQEKNDLDNLISSITDERKRLIDKYNKVVPILVKISPDNTDKQLQSISKVILKSDIDGLIVSNTSMGLRDNLKSAHASDVGGLSGKPLFELSNESLAKTYKLIEGRIPIIGVGGVASAEDAYQKIKLGASLVQLYSSLVYQGFDLVEDIKFGLDRLLKNDGYNHVSEAIGVEVK